MDWLQFFASVIGSIAWPAAIIFVAINFQQEIRRLLRLIKKIGAGGVSVEIAEQVEAVRTAAEAVETETAGRSADVTLDSAILSLAKTFPEAAVLQSFKELEGVLLQIRTRLPDDKPHRNLNEVLRALADQKYVSESVVALFRTLRDARNAAAHARGEEDMTSGEAVELVSQIKLLQNLLMSVLDQLPAKRERV